MRPGCVPAPEAGGQVCSLRCAHGAMDDGEVQANVAERRLIVKPIKNMQAVLTSVSVPCAGMVAVPLPAVVAPGCHLPRRAPRLHPVHSQPCHLLDAKRVRPAWPLWLHVLSASCLHHRVVPADVHCLLWLHVHAANCLRHRVVPAGVHCPRALSQLPAPSCCPCRCTLPTCTQPAACTIVLSLQGYTAHVHSASCLRHRVVPADVHCPRALSQLPAPSCSCPCWPCRYTTVAKATVAGLMSNSSMDRWLEMDTYVMLRALLQCYGHWWALVVSDWGVTDIGRVGALRTLAVLGCFVEGAGKARTPVAYLVVGTCIGDAWGWWGGDGGWGTGVVYTIIVALVVGMCMASAALAA